MSINIKKTVDLLAEADGATPIFSKKPAGPVTKFVTTLQLFDLKKSIVTRILPNQLQIDEVLQDSETGKDAVVLKVEVAQ